MRLKNTSILIAFGVIISLAVATNSTTSNNLGENMDSIKYFHRFHNDNEYLLSYKEEFEFLLNEQDVHRTDKYYKVYYGSDGKCYKADFFENGKYKRGYIFDSKERVLRILEEEIVNIWDYSDNRKMKFVLRKGEFQEYQLYQYDNNKLSKITRFKPGRDIFEYTIYNYSSWNFKTYDKEGKLIHQGGMVHMGK